LPDQHNGRAVYKPIETAYSPPASDAGCIGAPLHVIKHMGGWAKNNFVIEGKYIDPTITPYPAAWQYFG
jgi:hypothetical protein